MLPTVGQSLSRRILAGVESQTGGQGVAQLRFVGGNKLGEALSNGLILNQVGLPVLTHIESNDAL
jgi:hypothetical protein